ncbi:NAD(+) diphosphatase [Hespellia stercorisuis]|uniref:NAD(+) diphosphatase n=1 Tax=Hespellia stercorisuis DSM 15480 TaxID=1121950 RepID=A0A1M6URP2_9FIRM|nr:NAD(+) diphosphatase [Hespellia stercorisuis]SHK71814.1 NAD+ diphosphatase [Hespellia stercorisuis DSM 15480]
MIQDIAPHKYDNAYKPVPPEKDSIALYYEKRAVLLKRTKDEIIYPTFADLERLNDDIYEDYTYLFSIDNQRFYLVREINLEPLADYNMENIEIFREAEPQYRAFAGITGYQLYNWYESRRYCGRCGTRMEKDKKERMMFCPECHNMEYPKICPATIIGVRNGNRLLMSKYAGRSYKKYALLAGFVEVGETIEETVAREVMEEVGLKVKNVTYYKSQPWSFSDTVLMGFYADLDGDDTVTLDEEELALAEWFEREEIPVEPSRDSLTNEMIMKFKNGEI